MLILYYWPGTSSVVPHIVLEEIGAPYERQLVNLAQGEHKSVAFPVYAAFNKRMLERPAVCKVRGLEENILKGKDSWHGQYYAQPRSV
jgi:hypothetical protein